MPRLLFISFIDFGEMKSGSSVRPQRMYDAFLKLGFSVSLLSGLQNRRRERWRSVFQKFREIRKDPPDLCYVEPPSGPFFNLCDHLLLLYLKHKKIPTGLFYRDAYWLVPKRWQVGGLKKFVLNQCEKFDFLIIKHSCSVVFFPTSSMAEKVSLPCKSLLPPAGQDLVGQKDQFSRTGLYVGGTSLFYGTDILLGAFERLNETKGLNIRLILVCREGEGNELLLPYAGRPWLEVIHASGDEALEPIYRRSDFGIFSGRRDPYMDFSMPVKLFEYLSRALPIVTTDCVEAANFVEKNGVGIVAQDNPQSFAEAVAGLYDNPDCLPRLRKNAERALRGGNLWVHRAERAAQEIMQSRNLRS